MLQIGVDINPSDGKGGLIGTSSLTFGSLISKAINIAGVTAGIVLIAMLIIAGYNMMTAAGSGDAKKAQAAEKMLLDALIGFLIIVAVYLIIQLISAITGVPILNNE